MQTAIYVRISQDQTGEGLGVERQRQDCADLADQLGWTVAETYTDNDTSATTGKPRPSYNRMLDDIRSGRVAAIVSWHPDRIYRRPTDLAELVELCKQYNVAIATVNAGHVDLATPTGRLVAGLLAQVATYEVEHKAERQKRSVRQHREQGMPPGARTRMFGWTREGKVIEAEKDTLEWLALEVISGATLTGLCRRLNSRGVLTAGGNQWKATSLRKLLRNPRLAGHSTLKGEIVGTSTWDPILDDETWQIVNALLVAKSKAPGPRVALLPGLIYCGLCGTNLVTGGRRRNHKHVDDGSGEAYRTYRCPAGPGMGGCGRLSGDAEPIETIVEDVARGYLSRPPVRRKLAELRSGGQSHVLAEIDALERRVADIELAVAEGAENVAMLDRAASRIRDRIETLAGQLAATTYVKLPESVDVEWPTDLGSRRRLVELVVDRVRLERAGRGRRFDPERVKVEPTAAVRRAGD